MVDSLIYLINGRTESLAGQTEILPKPILKFLQLVLMRPVEVEPSLIIFVSVSKFARIVP